MDHPYSNSTQLAVTGRWQGLICGSCLDARIVMVGLEPPAKASSAGSVYNMEIMYNSVQHKNVLITQQRRRWTQINPVLFPARDALYDRPIGLYIGESWDNIVEENGWIFLEKAHVYSAIKIILCKMDDDPLAWAKGTGVYNNNPVLESEAYSWLDINGNTIDKKCIIKLKHKFSPIIIEAGRKSEFGDFKNFISSILSNKLQIIPTHVIHEAGVIIEYKGLDKDASLLVYNAANNSDTPKIGGMYVDYFYPKTFESPYIDSEYDSGIVKIEVLNKQRIMNFNNNTNFESYGDFIEMY